MPPRLPWGHRQDTTGRWHTYCQETDCDWQSSPYYQLGLANRAAVHHRRLVHLRASSEAHR